jgi:hypothetical protein
VWLVTQKTSTSQIALCSATISSYVEKSFLYTNDFLFLFFFFFLFFFSKNLGFKVLSYDTAQNPQLFRILFMAHQSTHGAAGRGWLELKVHNTPTPLRSAVTHEGFSAGIMIQCPVRLVFRLELAGAGPRYWLGRVAERVGRAAL